MASPGLLTSISGSEAAASLASLVVDYTGGDTRLGRRVRLSATVAFFALVLRSVVGGRPKKTAIKKDLRKVGKVAGDSEMKGDFDEYDIVIVGGGTAGCVLASRLTEDPTLRVLLLEAGGSSVAEPLSSIPSAFNLLFGSSKVFNFYTTLQQHSGGRRHYWPRARMLGGCSSINAQIFHYGAPSDYDEWARLAGEGAEAWAYKDFHRYVKKFERFIPNKAHATVVAEEHGTDGPVEVGFHGHHSSLTQRFIDSCVRAGLPLSADLNTPRGTLGVAKLMTYINSRGRRVTTETAYLTSEVLSRPNLIVAVNASVTRVLFDTSESSPRAVGVEFAPTKGGPRYHVRARKEVVLAAGAVHSPHILMLSGVGPAAHLKEHGIPVVTDLPGVGANLLDHPVVDVVLAETSGNSLNYLQPRSVLHHLKRTRDLVRYFLTGGGPFATNVAEAAAFFRSDDPAIFPHESTTLTALDEDSTSGPNAPDLEFLVTPIGYTEMGRGDLPNIDSFGLHMTLLRPTSVGNITLKSSDPFAPPILNPNYISTEHDIAVLERGMAFLTRVMHTSPLADVLDHTEQDRRLGHWLPSASPIQLRAYVRSHLETLYHPTSTARMAPLKNGGVVDTRLRVYGFQNLRVVDASIFPSIVSGHTAAPVIAVAEKASDLIAQDLTRA